MSRVRAGTGISGTAGRQGETQDKKAQDRNGATNGSHGVRLAKHQSLAGGFRVHCRGWNSDCAGIVIILIRRHAERMDSGHIFTRRIRALRRLFDKKLRFPDCGKLGAVGVVLPSIEDSTQGAKMMGHLQLPGRES